jgi:hypothetical protein
MQEEFSNDVGACTKRYGLPPVVGIPGTLAFGEVERGRSAQKGTLVQNNGGGDLNILNIRLGAESDGHAYYSLINGQPTGATLHPHLHLRRPWIVPAPVQFSGTLARRPLKSGSICRSAAR